MNQINAFYKLFLSYFKKEWKFEDYPLKTWTNLNAEHDDIKYGASFTNWMTFVSHGNTKEIAIENLKHNFDEYKQNNVLHRPGKKVPIRFAESNEIGKYEDIAVDFFDKIIEIDFYSCFISDYSSLHDFDIDIDETVRKIKSVYGIEPNEDLIFAEIFKQINFANT